MIYTLTMNPALDYVVDLPNYEIGKVNRVENEHIFYGGKGINVSVVLKELGIESCCLGFVAGFTGQELERGVQEKLGVKTDFIQVKEGRTRINVKVHSSMETELNGLGPIVEQDDIQMLYQQLDALQNGDVLVLSGSIPQSITHSIYYDILQYIEKKNVKVVVDATGELLMKTLQYHPFLIKPNNHELADMFGVELTTIDDIEKYARKLQDMGARNVLISMAKDGSLLIDEEGNRHQLGVCNGTVKNSVGAGDSMVAGFIAGEISQIGYLDTLKLATAAGGATAFSSGLATKDKILELLKQL
ncbi:MAG: 1-phosphofructokinase [Coprobacillus sp.]